MLLGSKVVVMNVRLVKNVAWAVAVVAAFMLGLSYSNRRGASSGAEDAAVSHLPGRPISAIPGNGVADADKNARRGVDLRAGEPARTALARRLSKALDDPDPVRRMAKLAELLGEMRAGDAASMISVFQEEWGTGSYSEEFRLFLYAWGRIDGRKAVEFALAEDSPVRIGRGARTAMAGWALADLPGARDWIERQEPGQTRNAMVYGLLDGWSRIDLAAAAAYAETQPRSDTRAEMIELLLSRHLRAGGIRAAQSWFDGISGEGHNDTYQRRAFLRIAQEMAKFDPSAAAAWVADHGGQEYAEGEVVHSVVRSWAKQEPTAALGWILGQPYAQPGEQNTRIKKTRALGMVEVRSLNGVRLAERAKRGTVL